MKSIVTPFIVLFVLLQVYSISAQQQLTVRRNDTTSLYLMVEPIGTSFGAFYGVDAGRKTVGSFNTILGYAAGQENRGGESNTFVGEIAGQSNKSGNYNAYFGRGTARLSRGSENTALGSEAGALNVFGNNNTFVGRSAGVASTGSNNVFLGYQAGTSETGSNKLYIENTSANSTDALIYGEFDNNYLRANANTDINGILTVNRSTYGFKHTDGVTSMGTYVYGGIGWLGTFSNSPLWFFTDDSASPSMIIEQGTGNVGIGTTDLASGYKLSVQGKIAAEEILVDLSGAWPDYVFQDDYKLPSLSELKTSIKKEGHLPDMPSAAEVKDNGVLLGDMNKKLLEKVEQLTLYIINQEERIKALEAKVNNEK